MSDAAAGPWPEVERALRALVEAGDLGPLEDVLAEDVSWLGTRFGGCHGAGEVLGTFRDQLGRGVRARLTELRSLGSGLLVCSQLTGAAGSGGDGTWVVVALMDRAGRISRIQDYEHVAAAERDLSRLGKGSPPPEPAADVVQLAPFVHVADVERSVAFYRLFGLKPMETFNPEGTTVWAFLESDQAVLMVAEADEPIEPHAQGVLFYLYCRHLAGLRERLLAAGVLPGEIVDGTPGPRQEMRVADPDGYTLVVAQIDDSTAVS
ncbi:MAG: VOC family protein [Acidimicrobiia bacterium]